jgi:hypothetical protein
VIVDPGGIGILKIIYSRFFGHPGDARIGLILLVGAARFELTTPCAQGRFQLSVEVPVFIELGFQ